MKGSNLEITAQSFYDKVGQLFFDVTLKEGDRTSRKRLEPSEFFGLFDKSQEEDGDHRVPVIRMPESVLCAAQGVNKADNFDAVVVTPAGKKLFNYLGAIFEIPFPALAAKITVKRGVRVDTSIYALDTDHPVNSSVLYQYPFGNVSSGGHACFGNIQIKDLHDYSYAPYVMELFLQGETNNDYWSSSKVKSAFKTQAELVDTLKKMDAFPNEWLNPVGSGGYSKVESLTKGMIVNGGVRA